MWNLKQLRAILLTDIIYIASIIDIKRSNNTISFQTILKVCTYFVYFLNVVTIFTSLSLFIWSCLHLKGNYLFFVLKAIIKNNKIDYKNNSNEIKTIVK